MERKWVAAIAAMIAAAFVIGVVTFGYISWTADPIVSIPTPVLPKPNAFDFFIAAGHSLKDQKTIDSLYSKSHKGDLSQSDLTLAEHVTHENKFAVAQVAKGLHYPYLNPPVRIANADFSYFKHFRELAKLFRLLSIVEMRHGDWSGSTDFNLNSVQMGAAVPHGSVLIGRLIGIGCQTIGRDMIWAEIDHLNAAQAHAAANRLIVIDAGQTPYYRTLEEEKWFAQSVLMKCMRLPGMNEPNPLTFPSKRTIMEHFVRYADQCIANAKKPYALKLKNPSEPHEALNAMVLPVLNFKLRTKDADNSAQNALLASTLALRAYRLEYGRYPEALWQLVPRYLPKVPDDPFALSGPIKYKAVDGRYVLYSVGPDGKDDGGKPICHASVSPTQSNAARYYVKEDSIGDVVAGINKQ